MKRTLIRNMALAGVLTAALAGCAGTKSQESTGEYIDDSAITTKVKTALVNDNGVHSTTDIRVETFKGRVQLAGFVKSAAERQRAEGIARSVAGVKSVSNNIEVR